MSTEARSLKVLAKGRHGAGQNDQCGGRVQQVAYVQEYVLLNRLFVITRIEVHIWQQACPCNLCSRSGGLRGRTASVKPRDLNRKPSCVVRRPDISLGVAKGVRGSWDIKTVIPIEPVSSVHINARPSVVWRRDRSLSTGCRASSSASADRSDTNVETERGRDDGEVMPCLSLRFFLSFLSFLFVYVSMFPRLNPMRPIAELCCAWVSCDGLASGRLHAAI